MAVVWRARDQVLARTVAVKLLHPHLASDESFLERFRAEALAAARLTHPNVVATYDTGSEVTEDDVERHFIVMEYCGGGTLDSRLRAEGTLDPHRALGVGATVANALSYAHANGIVHRDIKPANILLTEDGALKVGDFGIAKAATITSDITTTGTILGTVAYLSPEQAQGLEPDARSDVYSLGCVLYETLAGRPPFVEESQLAVAMKHVREAPPPLRSIRADIPRSTEQVVQKALEKDPDDRYASADEMRDALEQARGGDAQTTALRLPARSRPAARGRARPRGPSEPSFSLWPVVLVILAGIALAVIVTQLVQRADPGDDGDTGNGGAQTERRAIEAGVEDFDPAGGGEEHSESAPLAIDGDEATEWDTENYNDPLSVIGKPGVGLLFDLGDSQEVESVEIVTSTPGYRFELRAADERSEGYEGYDVVETIGSAEGSQEIDIGGERARYWLLWITELPGGEGGSAAVSEVRFFGP